VRIILDENVPFAVRRMLAPRQVTTVQQTGFRGLQNGALLAALEGAFDVFVTADKNLRYQQNLSGRTLAIVELPTNRWPLLRPLETRILQAIDGCQPSPYVTIIG
jgi:hypothetical protein